MAAVSDADFQALKDSIAALTQKLADMEQEMAAEKAKAAQAAAAPPRLPRGRAAKPAASSWADKVVGAGRFPCTATTTSTRKVRRDRNRAADPRPRRRSSRSRSDKV